MPILGTDISGVRDVDPGLGIAGGRLAYAQAIARRLTTPAGTLFYDREYGHDVRRYVNAPFFNAEEVQNAVAAEAFKDERTVGATVTATFSDGVLTIELVLDDGDGPFPLTLNVSQLTASVLIENA